MGGCSAKLGGPEDVLQTTAWVRDIVTRHQKQRKGLSKFTDFTFLRLSGLWPGEEQHEVTVGFLTAAGEPRQLHWLVITEPRSPHPGPVRAEIAVRTSFLPELKKYLVGSEYKRARHLVNIPELIHSEQRVAGSGPARHYLVLEDVSRTKQCRGLVGAQCGAGLGLARLNPALASLAQFHAVCLAWRHSLPDDSVLDLFPGLSRPPGPPTPPAHRPLLIKRYRRLLVHLHGGGPLPGRLAAKLDHLEAVCRQLSQPSEADMVSPLGTVGLGAVSPRHLAWQQPDPASPVCTAAITRLPNLAFTTVTRDLATWVFCLASPPVRRHYILDLLHNYATVLTDALDLLGIRWPSFGITFNKLCQRFFDEVEMGLLVSILVAMDETSEEELEGLLEDDKHKLVEDKVESADVTATEDTDDQNTSAFIPLSQERLYFLKHILDDVYFFLNYETRTRSYELYC